MKTPCADPTGHAARRLENLRPALNRRSFLQHSLVLAGGCAAGLRAATAPDGLDRLKPIGQGKGVHPGRVVWVHDPGVTDWKGPGDWHWWEGDRVKQGRVDAMLARAVSKRKRVPAARRPPLLRGDIRALLKMLVDVVVQTKKTDGEFRVTEIYYDPEGRHAV